MAAWVGHGAYRTLFSVTAASCVLAASCLVTATPASAEPPTPSTEPRSLVGFAVFEAAWSAWGAAGECLSYAQEKEGFTYCTPAVIGASINDVLNRLDQLDAQIAENQRQLLDRFDSVDRALTELGLQQALAGPLVDADRESEEALNTWEALARCLQRNVQGAPTCQPYTGVLGSEQPIESALNQTSQHFQLSTDRLRARVDLLPLVSAYTGVGNRTGLIPAAWRHYKGVQDQRSNAHQAWRNSDNVPLITPQLATSMNDVINYYTAVINRYAYVMILAEGMRPTAALNCGRNVPLTCRTNAVRSRRDTSANYISNAGNRYSVEATNARFRMPNVPQNAVMVIMGDTPTLVFNGAGGSNTLSLAGVRSLARTLNGYGTIRRISENYPTAAPATYVARTPIRRGRFSLYGCRFWNICNSVNIQYNQEVVQPRNPAPDADTCSVRIEMLNEPQAWDTRFWEWTRAKPLDDGARAIVAASSAPNYNGGWWVSFVEPWSQVFQNEPITTNFVQTNLQSTNSSLYRIGWGGWVRCVDGAAATKTPNAPGAPPLLRAAP